MAGSGVGNFAFAIAIEVWIKSANGNNCINELLLDDDRWNATRIAATLAETTAAAGADLAMLSSSSSGDGYYANTSINTTALPPCDGCTYFIFYKLGSLFNWQP